MADAPGEGLDRRPSRLGRSIAILAGVLAVVPLFVVGGALVAGALGVAVLAVGLVRGSRLAVSAGAVGLLVGVLLAGVLGAAPEPLVFSTAATVVAWDVAENAVGLGEQLGRGADTRRAELVHAAGSAALAAGTAGLGYAAFRAVAGPQPVAALVLLLFAGVVLTAALR